ncbi:glycosyltransferase [Breznakia pachnodae]|uniref:Glycosyltransferase involved in cell wall biosynthesis n=1 Tax=Breznakia pachnodae TaxID=265178 RepID=A0ABU0DZ15_9FIRM|nr:glycosyltransferase [Breznakia pachnodae]MDQ0359816.1 glycosyltransferase involved in cell wall biosynthesis [Breznakia pachnodae]
MKKICYFTLYDKNGASSKYRSYIFEDDLNEIYDVKWFYFWNNTYVTKYMHQKKKYLVQITAMYLFNIIRRIFQLLFIAPKCNVVIFQKACLPKMKLNLIKKLKKRKCKIIFDVDDAVYLDKKDSSDNIAILSDAVIVGNNTLYRHYVEVNENTIIIPTVDDTRKYEPYYSDTYNNKIIGWLGSSSTIDNLDLIITPINKVIERHPNIKFVYISDDPKDYLSKIKNSYFVKWSADTYLDEISKFTIGIMPLKSNDYNKGKCGFKLIQYLNMKKPVIASNVGVNEKIVDNYGYVINQESEWKTYIEEVLENQEKYNYFVTSIEKKFFKEYHYSVIFNKIVNCIESV